MVRYQYSNDRIKQAGSFPQRDPSHDRTANFTAGYFLALELNLAQAQQHGRETARALPDARPACPCTCGNGLYLLESGRSPSSFLSWSRGQRAFVFSKSGGVTSTRIAGCGAGTGAAMRPHARRSVASQDRTRLRMKVHDAVRLALNQLSI